MDTAHGSLTDRPWGLTLGALGTRGFSGVLDLDADGLVFQLGFANGTLVRATSPVSGDAAVKIAVAARLVTPELGAQLTQLGLAEPGPDEVAAVAHAAGLAPDAAARLARRVIVQRAARTFAAERGSFVITASPAPAPVDAATTVDVHAAIYLGARVYLSPERLAAELARYGDRFVLVDDAAPALRRFGFTDGEAGVLSALAAGGALAELAAHHRDPHIAHAMIYALLACRLCARVATTPTIAATPPRPVTVPPAVRAVTPTFGPRAATSPPAADGAPRARTPSPSPTVGRAPTPSQPAVARAATPSSSPAVGRAPTPSSPPAVGRTPSSPPAVGRAPTPPPSPPVGRAPSSPPARAHPPSSAPAMARTRTQATLHPAAERPIRASESGVFASRPSAAGPVAAPPRDRPPAMPTAAVAGPERAGRTTPWPPASAVAAPTASRVAAGSAREIKRAAGTTPPFEGAEPASPADRAALAQNAFRRGEIALDDNALDRAIAELTRAVELAPGEIHYEAVLAWARFCAAADKHAIADATRGVLAKAILRSKVPEAAHFYLGRVERMLGREREALRRFKAVLELRPDHREAASEVRVLEARLAAARR